MARKRMIAPSFWTDEKIGECNHIERLLFLGLISNADDEGIGRANPKLLKSLIFPYDDLRISDFEKSLAKLASLKLIYLYQYDAQNYYFIKNFNEHQTINRPTPSELPKPDLSEIENTHAQITEYSLNTHEQLTPNIKEVNISKVNIKENKKNVFELYAQEDENLLKALCDFAEMRKSVGKKMTDRACELLCGRLDKLKADGEDIVELINKSVQNSWLDVYPSKNVKQKEVVQKSSGRYDFAQLEKQAFDKVGAAKT